MSQSTLAGNDFSKGFISLLETGRTRISLRAAHILAGRLGVDVTDLLAAATTGQRDAEFMLLRGEQELRLGGHKIAADIADAWVAKAGGVLRARFQRLGARALIETTRSAEAVGLLDEALRTFRSHGAKDFVARTLYDLARAKGRSGATGEGIRFALLAEQAVERGDVVDRTLELEIHQFLAGSYYTSGDLASAELRADRARALAEDVADPYALAKLYHCLALARFERGDKDTAVAYARKSIELGESLRHHGLVAETWVTLAWLCLQRGQYGKAAEALDRAERLAEELDLPGVKNYVALNRGALALARGDPDGARRFAEVVARTDNSRLKAKALLLRAKAIAASDAPLVQVKTAFRSAIEAHESEPSRDQARAHLAFAQALATRSQTKEAYKRSSKAIELAGITA